METMCYCKFVVCIMSLSIDMYSWDNECGGLRSKACKLRVSKGMCIFCIDIIIPGLLCM